MINHVCSIWVIHGVLIHLSAYTSWIKTMSMSNEHGLLSPVFTHLPISVTLSKAVIDLLSVVGYLLDSSILKYILFEERHFWIPLFDKKKVDNHLCCWKYQKFISGVFWGGSTVKSACFSCRWPGFGLQHPVSQTHVTPSPGDSKCPLLVSTDT